MSFSLKQLISKGFIAAVILFSFSACGGKARPFVPINDGIIFKPARLAVICGETDDIGKNFVAALTEEMRARTTFTVLSQKDIAKKIKKYPFNIKMVEKAKDPKKPIWIDPAEIKKIKALQKKLEVDYVFVVWGNNLGHYFSRQGSSTTDYYYMSVYGNMFEYPKGNVVTFTDFSYNKKVRIWEAISFKKEGYHIEALIKRATKYLVDQFIKVTNSGKQA
ncbi:MAG: hypothetical protein ABFS18_05120 [Thermodesulfobacteriota bacterium]